MFKGGLSGKFEPNSFLVAGFTVMLLHLWGAHLPVFVAGPKGEPGQVATGVKGKKGDQAADGDVGDKDPQGDKGEKGVDGSPESPGDPSPSVERGKFLYY